MLGKVDIRVPHSSQPPKVVVSALEGGGAEIAALADGRAVGKHRPPQVQTGAVAGNEPHGSYPIARMADGSVVGCLSVFHQMEGHVDIVGATGTVGRELYKVLMEVIIARIVEDSREPRALLVEVGNGKLAGRKILRDERPQNARHTAVLDIVAEMADEKRITGMKRIDGIETALALLLHIKADTRIHIAHILHCRAQVLAGEPCLSRVEKHGLLTDALQCAVDPFRSILARKRIGSKRNLKEREPARIRLLTDVGSKLGCIKAGPVRFHYDLVEHISVVGDKLTCRTCRNQHDYDDGKKKMNNNSFIIPKHKFSLNFRQRYKKLMTSWLLLILFCIFAM